MADRSSIQEALAQLDVRRVRLASRLSERRERDCRDLAGDLRKLLGTNHVWCDTQTKDSSELCAQWCRTMLEAHEDVKASMWTGVLPWGRRPAFAFSLRVHTNEGSPMLEYSPWGVLYVRFDCPPTTLIDYLRSEDAAAAHADAAALDESQQEERELLKKARTALGANNIQNICSYQVGRGKVAAAARRLINNAQTICATANLSGATIAISDSYELLASGTICIPHDFEVSEVNPRLQTLLFSVPFAGAEPAANGGGTSGSRAGAAAPTRVVWLR